MAKYIVTITPPTPNGDLHIGHLSGPFLAADVFTRAQRQRGHDCVLVSYSDDYQSYMLRRGIERKRDPFDLAAENTDAIKTSLKTVDINVDHWMTPYRNDYFREVVQDMMDRATAAGATVERESQEPYCQGCGVWGYEAFGRGNCNICGSDSDASQCESCAFEPDARLMPNFRCKLCGKAQAWLPVNRVFLRLGQYEKLLADVFRQALAREPSRAFARQVLERGLHDWGMTRPGDAGLDLAEDDSRRIHTWVMGLAGYVATTREYAEQIKNQPGLFDYFWRDPGTQLTHFLGFDCLFSHAVVYPVLLKAATDYPVRQRFYSNQFLTLNGENLSTSRNHAIWIKELVAEACADSARLYMASVAPEDAESDFNIHDFRAWRNHTFLGSLQNVISFAAQMPAERWLSDAGTDEHRFVNEIRRRWNDATSGQTFSMRALAKIVLDLIATGEERLRAGKPVRFIACLIAVVGAPLHPRLSASIVERVGFNPDTVLKDLIDGMSQEYAI